MVESLGSLVEWNPHWGLLAVRGEGGGGPLLGLEVASQPTYILCHITTAIYSFLYLIMGLVTGGCSGGSSTTTSSCSSSITVVACSALFDYVCF